MIALAPWFIGHWPCPPRCSVDPMQHLHQLVRSCESSCFQGVFLWTFCLFVMAMTGNQIFHGFLSIVIGGQQWNEVPIADQALFLVRMSNGKESQPWISFILSHTVGGSEPRHSPIEVGKLSQLFTRFYTSQVVQDRSHLAPGQVELLREALKARVYAVSSVNGFQSQDRPSHWHTFVWFRYRITVDYRYFMIFHIYL